MRKQGFEKKNRQNEVALSTKQSSYQQIGEKHAKSLA
jgi:hypothetical protein